MCNILEPQRLMCSKLLNIVLITIPVVDSIQLKLGWPSSNKTIIHRIVQTKDSYFRHVANNVGPLP